MCGAHIHTCKFTFLFFQAIHAHVPGMLYSQQYTKSQK